MYTEQDYADICAQRKKRIILCTIPLVLLFAVLIYSLIIRLEALTVAATILMGLIWLFVHGLFIKPVSAYRRHMDQVMHGRVHTLTAAFKEMDDLPVLREGVRYFGMLMNVGRMDNEEDDRLFYYDANLPRPDWKQGEMITITYHDKALGKWERA